MKVTSNFRAAAIDVQDLVDTIEENLDIIVPAVTMDVYESLTDDPRTSAGTGTPRDTRRATNGWNISRGGTPDFSDDGEGNYSAPESPREAADKLGRGTPVYEANIANGVPYIETLDGGSSTQAPGGFVRRAVNRAVNLLLGFDVLDPNFKTKTRL